MLLTFPQQWTNCKSELITTKEIKKCEHWFRKEINDSPAMSWEHFTHRHRRKLNATWRIGRNDNWSKTIHVNYRVRRCFNPGESVDCMWVCVSLWHCGGFHAGLQVDLLLKMQIEHIADQPRLLLQVVKLGH